LVSEPGELLKKYSFLFDIRAVQAVVQIAIKVAEEYLPGGEELSEALRNLFFERAEEVIIQEEQEEKERREEKDQVMSAAEVWRANQLIYDQIAALGTFNGDSDAWYDWQKNFRRLTREFNNDLRYRVFRLMCGGLAERRLDEALSSHPVPDSGDPYQHAVHILNGIYVDEDQKDHEIVDFLQINQKASEPVYFLIERFEKQRLHAEDMSFEPNDAITRKTFMDGLLPNIRGKQQEGARPRTYQEAKRRVQEVVGPDGHLLKSYGEGSLNLQIKLLQEELLEIKRSNAELLDALKRMTLSQKIESSATAIEANPSAGPPTTLSLRSRNREYCDFCKMEGHAEKYCWRKHPEKRTASLAQLFVHNTS